MQPVIGIGAATWDHFYVVDGFPHSEGVVQARANSFTGGGPVATALSVIAAHQLPTQLLDVQGDDLIGQSIRLELLAQGVGLDALDVQAGASSAHAVVLVRAHDAARHITYFPSSAPALILSKAQRSLIARASMLHLNGRHEEAAREAVTIARQNAVPISFDGGAGRYRESIRDLVEACALRIVALDFARQFTGEDDLALMAKALLQGPAQVVVITDGVRGSHVCSSAGESFHQPAFDASPVIDTTGCGDVFHGAFIAAWLQQRPLRECAEHASRLAARNAEGLGGRFVLRHTLGLSG